MSAHDPRLVAQALDDLQDQLARWSSVATEMLAEAGYTQRITNEAVDRAKQHAALVLHAAGDDERKVQDSSSDVRSWVGKGDAAIGIVCRTSTEVRNVLGNANAALRAWESELDLARRWLTKAQESLEKALEERERAQDALQSAEWDLFVAESNYRDCLGDEDGRDCRSEAAEVRQAEREVEEAKDQLSEAEQEVDQAEDEVERAQARVACCEQAINDASQAVSLAQGAEADVAEATNSAERSLEFARAAETLLGTAQEEVAAEAKAAEDMMAETQAATSSTDEAASHLRRADDARASAKGLAVAAMKELEYRAQQLHEFDRPTLRG
jgi:chromosome segregation ATPase